MTERPDGFSAALAARLQGTRVEDLSRRTEETSTFVNPDGTLTTEDHGGAVHVMKDGQWADVDYSLVRRADGSWAPRASDVDVVVDGGASDEAGRVTFDDGSSLAVTWPGGALPTPTVSGGVATYAVSSSTDLVVSVTGSGLNAWIRLNKAPAADEPVFNLGLQTHGVDVAESDDSLLLKSKAGKEIGHTQHLVAWDARQDYAGDPAHFVPLDAQLSKTSTKSGVTRSNLALTTPAGFLTDPQVKYPVIIDPNIAEVTRSGDTWVAPGVTTPQGDDYRVMVGKSSTTASVGEMRSYLRWDNSQISGKSVLSASVKLYQYAAASCSAKTTNLHPLKTSFSATNTVWTTRPTIDSDTAGASTSYTTNIGGAGCSTSNGWVTVPVTKLAQLWAAGTIPNYGIVLNAPSDSADDSSFDKRYCSMNPSSNAEDACRLAERRPILTVTYNSNPGAPSAPTVAVAALASAGYANTSKPTLSTKATDAEGQQVKYTFEAHTSTTTSSSTLKSSCTTGLVNSGTSASCALGTALAAGTYYVRAKATDATNWVGAWSGWTTMVVDTTAPAVPGVTATSFVNNGWLAVKPTSNTFTFTGASDVVNFQYLRDADTAPTTVGAGSPPQYKLTWLPDGAHKLQVRALDKAGNPSAYYPFTFGSGAPTLTSPTVAGIKSTANVNIVASGPTASAGTVTPQVMWRVRGGAEDPSFDPVNGTAAGEWVTAASLTAIPAGTAPSVSTKLNVAEAAASLTPSRSRKLTVFDVQVCFVYTSPAQTRCTWTDDVKTHATATFVPHAFGDGFPTADAGPGQVALWTGEFQTSATDISVPGYTGDLSISRSYSTFDADTATAGVFGPGWKASFDGTDAGVAGLQVEDDTDYDGTISLIDDDGEALTYAQPGTARRLDLPGVYDPVDADTAEAGGRLEVALSGTSMTYTDADGTITTWTLTSGEWRSQSVQEPGDPGKTTFTYNVDGHVSRIVAPIPPAGDGTAVTCAQGGEKAGCRVLTIDYGSANANGDRIGQVKAISYLSYNPAKAGGAGMDSILVTGYSYDTTGRLVTVTDKRTGLATTYTYGANTPAGVPLLAGIKPAGLAAYSLTYSSPSAAYTNALEKVGRDAASSDSAAAVLNAFRYTLNTTSTGVPTLDATTVSTWGQAAAPTHVFAVFGQDKAGSVAATPSAGDMPYADLQFTDDNGYVLNTASYATGGWQYTATGYDDAGRVVSQLDTRATAAIRDAVSTGTPVDASTYATITRYNADITAPRDITADTGTIAEGTVLTPAGTLVTDVWDPTTVVTAPDGATHLARKHTHTDYDVDAPNDGVNPTTGVAYRLATSTTVLESAPGAATSDPAVALPTNEPVVSLTKTGYAPVDGSTLTGPTSGWTLGSPTTSAIDIDLDPATKTGDIVTRTVYDAEGRTIETRQPKSDGTDAGTTKTAYYSVGTQPGPNASCGSAPAWAGLVCRTATADSTQSVTTITDSYNRYLQPTQVRETRAGVTRTTTTGYDDAGRSTSVKTTVTGLASSTPIPEVRTEYDLATGAATATTTVNAAGTELGRISTVNDLWGRPKTYKDTDGKVTTTAYDANGRVESVTDPTGTTTNKYDGPTGNLTSEVVTGAGTFTAAYDAAGAITTQSLLGKVNRTTIYDRTGQETALVYTDTTGAEIARWTQGYDLLGRLVTLGGPSASGGSRDLVYTYDNAARLNQVADTVDDVCTERAYAFDDNGNRTSKTTTTHADDCASDVTATTTANWDYDKADRVQHASDGTSGYAYDELGRQLTIPGVDTSAGAGDLSVGYYDTDAARTITQGATTTTYDLDPAGRRATSTTVINGTSTTTTRHYTDGGDNPGWATSTTGTATTTSRYAEAIGGDLAATVTDGVASLPITDPHGDVLTTLDATTLIPTGTSEYDEYGNELATASSTGVLSYSWLGAKQRASDTTGVVLMGARLYNGATGLFTCVDPVVGGNSTAYAYPQDPINKFDLSGRWGVHIHWKSGFNSAWNGSYALSKWLTDSHSASWIRTGCSFAWGAIGTACGVAFTGAYARQHRWGEAALSATSLIGGGYATKAVKVGMNRAWRTSYEMARHTPYPLSSAPSRAYRIARYQFSETAGVAAGNSIGGVGCHIHSAWRSCR